MADDNKGAQGSTEAPKGDQTPGAGEQGKGAAAAGEQKTEQKTGDNQPAGEQGKGTEGTEGKQGEKGGKADDQAGQSKAPATYELKLPEGGDAYIGEQDLTFIQEVARNNDWTNEEAQNEINAAVERAAAREEAAGKKFLEELKADEDYGGTKLEETQRLANKAIDAVFPKGHRLRDRMLGVMNRKLVGNNLAVAAFMAEVGRRVSEDAPGQTPSTGGKGDAASKLYDHADSKAADGRT